MNYRIPWNVGNFLTNWGPVSFSERTLFSGVSEIALVRFVSDVGDKMCFVEFFRHNSSVTKHTNDDGDDDDDDNSLNVNSQM